MVLTILDAVIYGFAIVGLWRVIQDLLTIIERGQDDE